MFYCESRMKETSIWGFLCTTGNIPSLSYPQIVLRDAGPVFLSQRKLGKLADFYKSIGTYCTEKSKEKKFYDENPQLQDQLFQVKFEELAENASFQTKNIYDFLHWDFPENMDTWIKDNTESSSGTNW